MTFSSQEASWALAGVSDQRCATRRGAGMHTQAQPSQISESHLQDAVADEEQARELGWERGTEISRGPRGASVMLAEAGGITTYLFVLLISLIPRQGFYAPPRPEEARTR